MVATHCCCAPAHRKRRPMRKHLVAKTTMYDRAIGSRVSCYSRPCHLGYRLQTVTNNTKKKKRIQITTLKQEFSKIEQHFRRLSADCNKRQDERQNGEPDDTHVPLRLCQGDEQNCFVRINATSTRLLTGSCMSAFSFFFIPSFSFSTLSLSLLSIRRSTISA